MSRAAYRFNLRGILISNPGKVTGYHSTWPHWTKEDNKIFKRRQYAQKTSNKWDSEISVLKDSHWCKNKMGPIVKSMIKLLTWINKFMNRSFVIWYNKRTSTYSLICICIFTTRTEKTIFELIIYLLEYKRTFWIYYKLILTYNLHYNNTW